LHGDVIGRAGTRAARTSRLPTIDLGYLTDRVAERVEWALEDPDSVLFLIFERMLATERAYGLGDRAFWALDEAPAEYRLLDMQWNSEVRRITARLVGEFLAGADAAGD
jgi:hypothetical protein